VRTRSNKTRHDIIEALRELLANISSLTDVVVVEGPRDVESLRRLGYQGELVISSQIGVNDYDLMSQLSRKYRRILILTDFDQEGASQSQKFSKILEHEGVIVEQGLRRRVGKLMAGLGVYAIEDIDNMIDNFQNQSR
jgi:5S rRNA maturation endonuclease (ribonuclease M5)